MKEQVMKMEKFKKIGVLTSGGDAPGMNACIKAVVNKAHAMGIEVVGVQGGYAGLINGDLFELSDLSVTNIVRHGGTVLYSSRCPEFMTEEGMNRAVETCRKNHIDAMICIGGDGTFRGATDLTLHGVPSIGLPGTIDNDITATDYTIGFDTAVNTTLEMIDALRDTCESHNRVLACEVMGRHCGLIALRAGIAAGAVAVAVPEVPFDEAAAIEKIRKLREMGKRGMVIVVAEGMMNADGTPYAETLVAHLNETLGKDEMNAKVVRFGHVVRGGDPLQKDRCIAANMGCKAVEHLVAGESNIVMCEQDGKIVAVDISVALMADRMYKNTLKDGDLDRFTPEQIKQMKVLAARKLETIQNLCQLASDVGC